MKIEVELVRHEDKAKMVITFTSSSMGSFTVDTAYRSAAEIMDQYKRLYDEFSAFGSVSLNFNGVIAHDESANSVLL